MPMLHSQIWCLSLTVAPMRYTVELRVPVDFFFFPEEKGPVDGPIGRPNAKYFYFSCQPTHCSSGIYSSMISWIISELPAQKETSREERDGLRGPHSG